MATNVPITIWQPTNGNGEMSSQTALNITSISGNNLITISGNTLVTGTGVFTPIPVTIWSENDGL